MEVTRDPTESRSSSPEFRRERARLAALALHAKRPEIAREAGQRGGEATVSRSQYGRSGWGLALAMRRWYPKTSSDSVSRAPMAGAGADEGGASEPGPVTARSSEREKKPRPPEKT